MFAEDKSLSRERICEKTGLSDGTIKREIAFLKKSGYLERIGSLKTAHLQSSVFKLSKDLIDSIHEEGIVAYTS